MSCPKVTQPRSHSGDSSPPRCTLQVLWASHRAISSSERDGLLGSNPQQRSRHCLMLRVWPALEDQESRSERGEVNQRPQG